MRMALTMRGRWWDNLSTVKGEYHAFITGPDGRGMKDLGTFGRNGNDSYANGINDAGQVVGHSFTWLKS